MKFKIFKKPVWFLEVEYSDGSVGLYVQPNKREALAEKKALEKDELDYKIKGKILV